MARPATPLSAPTGECNDGALSLDDGARFLGISKRQLERIIASGELEAIHEGRKPRVLKQHLIARLEKQLQERRDAANRARNGL